MMIKGRWVNIVQDANQGRIAVELAKEFEMQNPEMMLDRACRVLRKHQNLGMFLTALIVTAVVFYGLGTIR